MKKQIALFLSVALLLALCGCTARKEPTGESDTEVVNPIHETDAAGVAERLGATMTAPEGAENVSYRLIDGEQPIGEMTFTLEGRDYAYRMAPSAMGEESIDGMHYDWQQSGETPVGYLSAALSWNEGGAGVIRWFDTVPGMLYSLSMNEGASREALSATANLLFAPLQGEADGDVTPAATEAPQSGEDDPATAESDAFAAAYRAAIERIRTDARPGTAGGSLVSAGCCAELCDVFTAHAPEGERVRTLLEEYMATLDGDALALYRQQLESVLDSFDEVAGPNGAGLLETAGCSSTREGWDAASLRGYLAQMGLAGKNTAAYAPVLEAYAAAKRENYSKQQLMDKDMNFMAGDCTLGYLVRDLDGDGTDELVIGPMEEDDFYRGMILELYTLDEQGAPRRVLQSTERDRWYNVSLPVAHNDASSSAAESASNNYLYDGGEMTLLGEGEGGQRPMLLCPLLP